MAANDNNLQNQENSVSQEDAADSATVFESDIGEDWGEAFQAEEFVLDADEEESEEEFFLEDDSFEETPVGDAGDETLAEAGDAGQSGGGLTALLSFAGPLSRLMDVFRFLKTAFQAGSLPVKIGILGVPLLLLILLVFLAGPEQPAEQLASTNDTATEDQTEPGQDNQPTSIHIQEESLPQTTSPQKIKEEDVLDLLAKLESVPPEKVRTKWRLPSFVIPSSSEIEKKAVSMVTVDLTLILLLEKDKELPEDKTVLVRDSIYQFYSNRPLNELHRYLLARGEMGQNLHNWINKSWPDNPITQIVFDRYQIL